MIDNDHHFFGPVINALRYKRCLQLNNQLSLERLSNYLSQALLDGGFVPYGTKNLSVSSVVNFSAGIYNDIYSIGLSYELNTKICRQQFILKTYKPMPNHRIVTYRKNEETNRGRREFEVLNALSQVDFPCPKPLIYEPRCSQVGYPFMITSFEIMADKEENKNSNKTINRRIDGYAYALARLHSLNVTKLNLKGLNPPKDSYAFAKSWPRSLKYYLQLETRHPDEILQLYRKGIDWLEANSSNNICSCFSILQGDTHPSNSMFNSDNRFILFDFECSQIGDPAYDIARMCHLIKFIVSPHNPELAKGKADRFLARYQKAIGKDVSARLKFYSVASLIELSIPYSTSISNPMRANHYLRRRFLPSIPFLRLPIIFLAFPFLRVSFVNKKIGMEGNILWLKYAKRYLEISLN